MRSNVFIIRNAVATFLVAFCVESNYVTIIVCLLSTIDETVEYYLGQIIQYEEKEDVFELMK